MATKKRIYKTVISYTILSEEPYNPMSLGEIEEDCGGGDCIGGNFKTTVLNQELIGKKAVEQISELGSDPEFFQMDCEGNDISDEDSKDEDIDLEDEEF